MPLDIDLDFLREQEGFELGTYVPRQRGQPHPNSGPTVATGIDLTQQSEKGLLGAGVDPGTVQLLMPLIGTGVKGQKAQDLIDQHGIKLSQVQADQLDQSVLNRDTQKLAKKFTKASGRNFESLPREIQTVLTSVSHQYGNLESATPNFWKQVTTGKFDQALNNLRNFGDDFSPRREREADFIQQAVIKEFLRRGI